MATNERPALPVQLIVVAEQFSIPALEGKDENVCNGLKKLIEKFAGEPRYASVVTALYTTPAAEMLRDNPDDPIVLTLYAEHAEAITTLYDQVPARPEQLIRTAA